MIFLYSKHYFAVLLMNSIPVMRLHVLAWLPPPTHLPLATTCRDSQIRKRCSNPPHCDGMHVLHGDQAVQLAVMNIWCDARFWCVIEMNHTRVTTLCNPTQFRNVNVTLCSMCSYNSRKQSKVQTLYGCEKVRIKCLEIQISNPIFILLNFGLLGKLEKLECYIVNNTLCDSLHHIIALFIKLETPF